MTMKKSQVLPKKIPSRKKALLQEKTVLLRRKTLRLAIAPPLQKIRPVQKHTPQNLKSTLKRFPKENSPTSATEESIKP